MPGGIDPHVHLEMPFMGTSSTDDFYTGHGGGGVGGDDDGRFLHPGAGRVDAPAWDEWAAKSKDKAVGDYAWHMCVTGWNERFFDEMAEVVRRGVNTFKHFMAYKGALMVNDDEMFASFSRCAALGALPLVHAENGDVVAALQTKLWPRASPGRRACVFAAARGRGRGGEPGDHDRRCGRGPPYIVHVLRADARGDQAGAAEGDAGLGRAAGAVPGARRERVPSQGLGARGAAGDVAAFRGKEHQAGLWAGLAAGSLQVVATDHCAFTTEQKKRGSGDFTKIPNGTGGLEDRMSVVWTHGVETGRLTPEEFVAVTSTNSAKILNMHPRRGRSRSGRTPTSWSGIRRQARRSPRRTRSRRSTTTSSRG